MKKTFSILCAILLIVTSLASCSDAADEYEALMLEQHAKLDWSNYNATITLSAFEDNQQVVSIVSTPERQSLLIESNGKCVYFDSRSGIEKTTVKKDADGKAIAPIETTRETRLEDYDFYKHITQSEAFVKTLDRESAKRSLRRVAQGASDSVELEYLYTEHPLPFYGNLSLMFFMREGSGELDGVALANYTDKSAKGINMISVEFAPDPSNIEIRHKTLSNIYDKFASK